MSAYQIRTGTAAVLHAKAATVAVFDKHLRSLCRNLWDTCRAHKALGVAAPQIGKSVRVAVVQAPGFAATMVNPVIQSTEGSIRSDEGCLSLPQQVGGTTRVTRAERVHVTWQDEFGGAHDALVGGLAARAVQHEVDHLDGLLVTDRARKLRP